MKFVWGGIELTDWDSHPAQNVSVNGQEVTEFVDIVRSLSARVFDRGNLKNTFQFSVRREFATLRDCQVYLCTHFTLLPKTSPLQIICGGNGESTQDCFMENAVLASSPQGIFNGVEAIVTYVIQGGAVTTDVPPSFLVGGDAMILRGKEPIAAGVDFKAKVFASPFPVGSTVEVFASIGKPGGSGSNIFTTVREDLTDRLGFTVEFSGDTPDADHKLNWIAIGT